MSATIHARPIVKMTAVNTNFGMHFVEKAKGLGFLTNLIISTNNSDYGCTKDFKLRRELSKIEKSKTVSQRREFFENLKRTGNYSSRDFVSGCETVTLRTVSVATPKAALQERPLSTISLASSKADALDKPVTHPVSSVLTSSPARSQAEVKPEPAAIHNKKSSAPENQPSLLSRIKSQSAKSWISLKNYISSLKNAYRQQQSEKSANFENTARTKSESCGTMIELTNAYDNSPFTALFLYNAAKQELIFNAINDIITQAGKENKEIDLRKLCDQANRYAVNSGANAKFFTLSKNNTIEHNIKYGVPTMQQRVSRVEEDIGSKNETSATLRRNSQSLSGRQRANSVQSITRRMVDDAYSKLFNDIQNDKDKIFGTRHSFDQNEMCAALLEGQPELAGLRRSAT